MCILYIQYITITQEPISELEIAGEALPTHPINLRFLWPISTLVKFAALPRDPITLQRLIVSKTYWRRSGGGGAKTKAANWIVTIALLCHSVLLLHWLLSRPLITRMNGIDLILQQSGRGTFRHSCIWKCSRLRIVKRYSVKWMQLTRWPADHDLLLHKETYFLAFLHSLGEPLKSVHRPTQAKTSFLPWGVV